MRNLKKVLALVLVLALSLTMFAGAIETVLPFDDVDELTAEQLDSLKLLYALGVIKGDGTSSNPNSTYTRAELAATLYRLYTGDAEEKYVSTYSSTSPYFADASGAWYTPYVNWAYLKGVILGYGDGNFGPNDPVTGVQAATMLARLLGYEVSGENWDITARRISIENRLDDGVESKDLYNENLTRGDMFVMVANTLNSCELGSKVTLAEKIFDLEIIEHAILVGYDHKLGGQRYTVFGFKDEIGGDVRWFITDLLSVEEAGNDTEVGEKYTLYVAKTKEANGYKILYAAYEEERGTAYYNVVEGTVDDGKLNVTNPAKADYLLNLLDDYAITYVNGVHTKADKAEAFAAFKAAYGVKNGASYKLIDNDGDGKYEYLIIYKLTFADLTAKEIVANVVSYNTVTGEYTLSDGNSYVAGQYWAVNKDGDIIGLVNVAEELELGIGSNSYTASPVQYKFTVSGKYIMKVEVADTTYFAGNYVLGMGVVGTSTYKGAQYVKFLTEDNTDLYAYVTKVNNLDVRVATNFNDNNPFTAAYYNERLFYVNAYGDDCVELYTVNYINSNAMYQNYVTGRDWDIETRAARYAGKTFDIYSGVSTKLYADFEANGYVATDRVYYYVDLAVAPKPGEKLYAYDAATKTYYEDPKGEYTIQPQYYMDATIYKGFYAGMPYNDNKWLAYSIPSEYVAATKIPVSINVAYLTENLQIFKAYGTWYLQQYGEADNIGFDVYFGDVLVNYDVDNEYWYVVADPAVRYNTAETDPKAIYDAVLAAVAAVDADNAKNGIYSTALPLNVSKGVVFAFGSVGNTLNYKWKAYNFDEFDVACFGIGRADDDRDEFTFDEAVITLLNGQLYVKAAKVTVANVRGYNVLPLDKILTNGVVFIYDKVAGKIDIAGHTVISHEPNGGSKSYYIPFGLDFGCKDGDIVYATQDENGNITNVEFLTNILDLVARNTTYGKGDTGVSYKADGTVTRVTEYFGITTSSQLDLEKTFFARIDSADKETKTAKYAVIDSAEMAKTIASGYQFAIWSVNGYNFVLAAPASIWPLIDSTWAVAFSK